MAGLLASRAGPSGATKPVGGLNEERAANEQKEGKGP